MPSDSLVVYLVKVQRLLEKIELALGLDNPELGTTKPANNAALFVSSGVQDLKQLQESMPEDIRQNGKYLSHVLISLKRKADNPVKSCY